jgi:hypothetical protein
MTNFASFPTASRRPRGRPPIAAADGFTVNIVSDAPVHVLADQNEIFRVLFNLLHNALTVARAASRLWRIDVSVERAGRIVVLRIAGNGDGLARKVAERCFRRPPGAVHGYVERSRPLERQSWTRHKWRNVGRNRSRWMEARLAPVCGVVHLHRLLAGRMGFPVGFPVGTPIVGAAFRTCDDQMRIKRASP